jgi:hypothetical protein
MVRVFCRSNGSDYFQGEFCPFDGWSSPKSKAISEASRRLIEKGIVPSVTALQKAGLPETALARAVVIEFGAESSAFEAMTPEVYLVQDQVLELAKCPPGLK